MKQKYVIIKSKEEGAFRIREYLAVADGDLAFVCEEVYDPELLKCSLAEGENALGQALRRPNMYPRHDIGEKIVACVRELMQSAAPDDDHREVLLEEAEVVIDGQLDLSPEISGAP